LSFTEASTKILQMVDQLGTPGDAPAEVQANMVPWLIAFRATLSLPTDMPPELQAIAAVVTAWHLHQGSLKEGDNVDLPGDVIRGSVLFIDLPV
jgi:hypothetical protein